MLPPRFCWFDLMTPEPDGAIAFYTEVVGWKAQPWEGAMPYTMWAKPEGGTIGGVMPLAEEAVAMGAPPHWLGYVLVDDVDYTVKHALELGAEALVAGEDIPEVGRFAILRDPQGAVIALFQPKDDAPGSDDDAVTGEMSWHELATTDLDAASAFYYELFGWKKIGDFEMEEGWMYDMYGYAQRTLGGMFRKPDDMQGPPMWIYYIAVDGIDAACDRIRANGGTVVNGPMEVPGGSFTAQALDPQGAFFALHSTTR